MVKEGKGKKEAGEQTGQRGCASRWARDARLEKEFKKPKVGSVKVITYHKLPGQQA